MGDPDAPPATIVGRYALYDQIGAGGMATVHCARLLGPAGFSRIVAIKRLYPQYARDPEFVSMFLDEARTAARVRHPNVVPTLDVVAGDGELFLVMEYVQGESLSRIVRAAMAAGQPFPVDVVSSIVCGVLHGLHAAHEATDDAGQPLSIVHRDVSPQNVLVGADGVARVLDFGVAKAAGRIHTTRDGVVKGKLAYMAPEQLRDGTVDRRADIFAAGILLWEVLTLRRLFAGDNEGSVVTNVLERLIVRPSELRPGLPALLDDVTVRALERSPDKRFSTAREMALALEASVPVTSPTRVAAWVEELAGDTLALRAETVARVEGLAVPVSPSSPPRRRISRRAPKVVVAACALAALASLVVFARRGASTVPAPLVAVEPPVAAEAPPLDVPLSVNLGIASAPAAPSAAPSADSTAHPLRNRGASARPCTVESYFDEARIKHYVRVCK